jgi:fermentation-respiration switch protein FrsA (DUF1100 family)
LSDWGAVLRTLGLTLAVGAIAGALLYSLTLALLITHQRDILFVRGRSAQTPDAVYRVRTLIEPDGTRLAVWQAPAESIDGPVIAFFYGNAGTLSDFAGIGLAFHREGYGVLLASYRGYPGNSGHPSEDGIMSDARAVLAALPRGHGPVILWGQSLGTGVAARMAAEGYGAALILQSPYTAVVDVAARRFPIFPVRKLMLDRFDTAALVSRIRMPVLIMSGTADATVPFDMGETLSRLFGPRATFVPFPGEGHELPARGVRAVADKWLRTHASAFGPARLQ